MKFAGVVVAIVLAVPTTFAQTPTKAATYITKEQVDAVNATTGAITGTPNALGKSIDRRPFKINVQSMDSTQKPQGSASSTCIITISK